MLSCRKTAALDLGDEVCPGGTIEAEGRLAGVLGVPNQNAVPGLGDLDTSAISTKCAPTPRLCGVNYL